MEARAVIERLARKAAIKIGLARPGTKTTMEEYIARTFTPVGQLIRTVEQTIEFYGAHGAHGGPMGDLRAALRAVYEAAGGEK